MASDECTLTNETNPAVAAFEFLHHQTVFHIRHARAPVSMQAGAIKTEVGHRFDQLFWKAARAIAFLNDGNKVVFNELTAGVADQAFVVLEQRVEFEEIDSSKLDGH